MCDTVFAFGQRGGFHFECPSQWYKGFLPKDVEALFTNKDIASVHCMALGKGDSYFISYLANDGMSKVLYRGLPKEFTEWLEEKGSDGEFLRTFSKVRLALGPYNESFFAHDSVSFRWRGLPKDLDEALEQFRTPGGGWRDTPKLIALGYAGDYLLVTVNGARAWKLVSYKACDKLLDLVTERKLGGAWIANITLNPYRIDNWVIQSAYGQVVGSGMSPGNEASFDKISAAVQQDALKAVQAGTIGNVGVSAVDIGSLIRDMKGMNIKKF